ncbi:hypothetical protein JDV02_009488 [Purpureocillium takamizusanense]|uniref:Hard-surface induced protein 5 n=1 Tax=Purpureocillium takamizusanense TaxID=2060973 RepID=A0A9Q8QQR9_9HYPO|nr:uncharacterized protein JDV02_009488 [Purpureocillium takamizusanense]UNI23682.1 hypothetical protein JDV02_009488 [Purpureocillium takamizusanense]
MRQKRVFLPLAALAAMAFVMAVIHLTLDRNTTRVFRSKPASPAGYQNQPWTGWDQDRSSFEQVALKYGTDKVTSHSYQDMYDKYLAPVRNSPLKMLEIGLGCNMAYGPGASYYTWLEFLPRVELYYIESDAVCAAKYERETANAHVYIGDQADAAFLEQFASETAQSGQFDVVVDDGGHTMEQQITSLVHLWPIVKPGGIYVIEDLQTSYWEGYGGDPMATDRAKHTTVKQIFRVVDDIMTGRNSLLMSRDVLSVDCMAEICTLRKSKAPLRGTHA